jgi:hypothetical protein
VMLCGGMWSEQGVTIPSPAGAEVTVERIDIGQKLTTEKTTREVQ